MRTRLGPSPLWLGISTAPRTPSVAVLTILLCALTTDTHALNTYTFSPDNIVKNPSFEILDTSTPDRFVPWHGQPGLYPNRTDTPDGKVTVAVNVQYTTYVSQVLNTIPGQEYRLSFFAQANWAVGQVDWGGESCRWETDAYAGGEYVPYMQFSYTLTASSSSTTLGFSALPGGYNPGYYLLDAVEVVPVPEPTIFALGLGTFLLAVLCRCKRPGC